jgi:hypothetical protein
MVLARSWWPAVTIAAVLFASAAAAQVSTFDLSGTVVDGSGGVIPGASVQLRNVKTGLTREATTDDRGRYHFVALPVVGEYEVRTSLDGFAIEERTGLVFQANSKPVIDFTLRPAGLAESVRVEAQAPVIETRKAELSLTVDQKRIETMPLNGRNYLGLATGSSRPASPSDRTIRSPSPPRIRDGSPPSSRCRRREIHASCSSEISNTLPCTCSRERRTGTFAASVGRARSTTS